MTPTVGNSVSRSRLQGVVIVQKKASIPSSTVNTIHINKDINHIKLTATSNINIISIILNNKNQPPQQSMIC